jgi:FkbM family methyltransferase
VTYWIRIPRSRGRFAPLAWLDIVDGETTYDQRAVRRRGLRGFQPWTTAAVLALCEMTGPRTALYDIGANGGLYSWLAQAVFPDARVFAFEPVPSVARAAQRIAARNGLRVRTEQLAVSDCVGELTLHLSEKSDASNSLTPGFRESNEAITVRTTTVDAYAAKRKHRPRVLKIDVELHEVAVLLGAKDVLTRHRPALILELLEEFPERAAELRAVLESFGYVGQRITPHALRGQQEDETLRDWVFFPVGIPDEFPSRYEGWARAVSRCAPTEAKWGGPWYPWPQLRSYARSDANR